MLLLLVRASDQNIIDRKGFLMRCKYYLLLVLILFYSQASMSVTSMSVHRPSADERLLSPTLDLCAFALSLSSRPISGDAAKEFTTNDSGNRNSE